MKKSDEEMNVYKNKFINEDRLSFLQSGKGEAYKTALDTRKFEIQMYWTRTNYFFLFVSAAIAAYGVALGWKSGEIGINEQTKRLVLLLISAIGFIVSLSWYLANKGGKFWHENWEYHVDLLEQTEVGSLYKTVLSKSPNGLGELKAYKEKLNQIDRSDCVGRIWCALVGQTKLYTNPLISVFLKPSKSYPYSPSKVNLILSVFTTILFLSILIASFIRYQETYKSLDNLLNISMLMPYAGFGILGVVVIFGGWMILSSTTNTNDVNLSLHASYRNTEIVNNITPAKEL